MLLLAANVILLSSLAITPKMFSSMFSLHGPETWMLSLDSATEP